MLSIANYARQMGASGLFGLKFANFGLPPGVEQQFGRDKRHTAESMTPRASNAAWIAGQACDDRGKSKTHGGFNGTSSFASTVPDYCPVAVTEQSTVTVIPPPAPKVGMATPRGAVVFCSWAIVRPAGHVAGPLATQLGAAVHDKPVVTGS